MSRSSPPSPRYVIDPEDPRAPPSDVWEAMTPDERARVVDQLPSELDWASPPEGDPHRLAKESALDRLGGYFRRIRRRVYLSSELPVYYPGERVFAPDVIAVLDVEDHARHAWVVSAEGRGLDFALEVIVRGDRRKDTKKNVERYARLGVQEYFVFDQSRRHLLGHALPPGERVYDVVVSQDGRWPSRVLGLDLGLGPGGRLRFMQGTAEVLATSELLEEANRMVADVLDRTEELARELEAETERATREAERATREAERADRLAERLRALGVDPDATEP